ncbi:hypothetical protein, partial [Glutamicibacter ardleyensis]|uniref:hypothetical protein n=1 Tax=Glutamicibacter ardleyensis TaxID=225894 RepID=UPI003F8D9ACA
RKSFSRELGLLGSSHPMTPGFCHPSIKVFSNSHQKVTEETLKQVLVARINKMEPKNEVISM